MINPVHKGGCVYIMANKNNTVLYIGVTSDLIKRILEHKEHKYPLSFTSKFNCDKIVYYKQYDSIEEAILNEKKLKDRSRKYKEQLINSVNPLWKDLWEEMSAW
jgi:putative endonuclease